jgi:hypothetical protein
VSDVADDPWVVQRGQDPGFALETLDVQDVGAVKDLEGDGRAVEEIARAKNSSHPPRSGAPLDREAASDDGTWIHAAGSSVVIISETR